MTMAGLTLAEVDRIMASTNYEIEVRYRINKGGVKYAYSNNGKLPLLITHNQDNQSMNLLSAIFLFKFIDFKAADDEGFNIVRLIRQNDMFSIYHNGQHLFTSDVWSTELPNKLVFSIAGDVTDSNFDLDYFRIYERL
jgi:hypothetical protein